jgi:geranylgeranyl diphosphate synthase type II
MRDALKRQADAPPLLLEAMEYSLMAGGKRLRPVLVLESAIACGREVNQSALAAAAAIELIHTFSLVHDDLPAMDNDDLRRGRPTNHKVYGEAMAILAGDGMISLAFELIATDAEPKVVPRLIAELAHATGPQGMIGGQVLDMDGEQKPLSFEQLQQLHRMKTGALLRSSCRLGALSTNASEAQLSSMTEFGRYLGLAFQIVDDLLDVTATPEQMGKATGKDAAKGKNTYPALLGIEETRSQAHVQLESALRALEVFGPSADGLRALAKFVVERQV